MRFSSDNVHALLFDWDGTLVDSAMSAFLTFQKALQAVGVTFTEDHFNQHFTPDWHRMYEAVGLDSERWALADAAWKESYPCVTYSLVPGARDTLVELRRRGYRLGIVTSGSQWRLDPEIAEYGLTGVFDIVICNEHVQLRKPHPEGLLKARDLLHRDVTECVYVGDVPEDILAGKNAAMRTVGVRSGYPTSRHLSTANPDLYLDSIPELLNHFPQRPGV
jgi:HAD superfamily hydrolase (TIGR01549 family)